VIAEITGSELPNEVVVIGGHIDSWDVGQGAHDDGGGCLISWEAIRLLKAMGLRPRRTIRAVLFTNEENGGRGAQAYLNSQSPQQINNTVFAMESDAGMFTPVGLSFDGTASAMQTLSGTQHPHTERDVLRGYRGYNI
jgi:carboxypeptidase Q